MHVDVRSRLRGRGFSIPYNLLLITVGSALIGFGVKAVAIPHGFITGGMSGAALLVYYIVGQLTTGQWFWLLNLPIFLLAWWMVSRRFFFYSLYGMAAVDLLVDALHRSTSPVILVSNEVGYGIVPENSLARQFRDMAGLVNQRAAQAVDKVIVSMAGIPVQIKPGQIKPGSGRDQVFGNGEVQ